MEEEFKFRPEDYTDFLINKIGFKEYHDLGAPKTEAKGNMIGLLLDLKYLVYPSRLF